MHNQTKLCTIANGQQEWEKKRQKKDLNKRTAFEVGLVSIPRSLLLRDVPFFLTYSVLYSI